MPEAIFIAVISALAAAGLVWYSMQGKSSPQSSAPVPDDPGRLHGLIEATVGTTGETYFYALVRELALFLQVDAVFLASCIDDEIQEYQSLAFWCDGSYIMNHRLSLQHSLRGEGGSFWYLENSASKLFPNVSLLHERFAVSGFFAVKLQDSSGRQIGILAGLNRASLHPEDSDIQMIKLFVARASSELERIRALGETLMEKERAQITLHSIGDGVITTDSSGCIDYMNPIAEALTGWRYHQAMGLSMEAVLHLEDERSGNVIPDPAQHCLAEKRVIAPKTDNVLISRSGERYSIQGTAAPMIDAQGNSIGVVLVFKDVSASRRMQKMMVHQATHDPLTGLANRVEFEQRLDSALQSARDFENTHALLFLDLDQFKVVNDSAGHVAGDELLKQISSLLAGQLRGRDTLGRLGGDEFAVLLENCPLVKAGKVAEMLIDTVREYRFVWDQATYRVGVSIGIVPIRAETVSRKQLMHDADQACYKAKDLGRGCFYIHSQTAASLVSRPGEKLQRKDIDNALAEDRFLLMYQPIIALDADQTLLHRRVEVLLRMLDNENEIVIPGAFLPAASRLGLVTKIDRWVINRLLRAYTHVFVQNPNLVASVNLSSASVADESLIEHLLEVFGNSVVKPEQICFEMSEASFSQDLANASRLIERLHDMGCQVTIDNFGSGLANFSALKDLPLDFIKIEGQLIRDIGKDDVDLTMVTAINQMAHLLNIRTVAENMDNELVLTRLKSIGVDYAQGFYLGDLQPLDTLDSSAVDYRGLEFQLN
jgi:diguanylate cyclase (GGDEF)-like protein/PAS domain S-box-containing protein